MKWVLVIISILIVFSVISVFKYGLAPRAVPIMRPTYFNDKQEIGGVIFRRLFQDMKKINGILVETDPTIENGERVWLGLLKVASQYGKKFDFIIQHQELKILTNQIPSVTMDFIENKKEFHNLFLAALQSGKHILIHGPLNTELPHSKSLKGNVFTITQQIFVTHPEDEKYLLEQCPNKKDRVIHKGCQALHLSRRYYRKKLRIDRLAAALEKFKNSKFTLFIHEPKFVP